MRMRHECSHTKPDGTSAWSGFHVRATYVGQPQLEPRMVRQCSECRLVQESAVTQFALEKDDDAAPEG